MRETRSRSSGSRVNDAKKATASSGQGSSSKTTKPKQPKKTPKRNPRTPNGTKVWFNLVKVSLNNNFILSKMVK